MCVSTRTGTATRCYANPGIIPRLVTIPLSPLSKAKGGRVGSRERRAQTQAVVPKAPSQGFRRKPVRM